ncbi:MAG: hypothetical protein HYZ68_03765 [Chloroflexi bacterium]|nr:hypothetical protein [Chloroflexota bacterium]
MERSPLRLDTLLLLLMVAIHGVNNTLYLGPPAVLLAGIYLALDLGFRSPHPRVAPWLFRIRLALATLAILFLAVLPLATLVAFRVLGEPGSDLFVTTRTIHDGALQTEAAVRFLLEGRNPYVDSYAQTLVARYPMWEEFQLNFNPAIYHYVYLPVTFMASIPFYLASQGFLGWYDQRIAYGLLFFLLLWLLPLMAREPAHKLGAAITVGLNPLMMGFLPVGLAAGINDYFVLSLVVLAVVLWRRGRLSLSAAAMALALASKQTAWFALPLWGILVWHSARQSTSPWAMMRPLIVLVLLSTMLILPFVLWSPGDFWDDTISYLSGSLATSFPIKGFGLSGILLAAGILPSSRAYFPFWVFQLLLGVPALLYAGWRLYQRGSLREFWFGYSILLFAVNYTSRYFHTNHLGYIVALLFLGFLADDRPPEHSQTRNGKSAFGRWPAGLPSQ